MRFLWVDDVNSDDPEVVTFRFRRFYFGLVSEEATTAKIFDPLGLISPVIVPLKLVFQMLYKENSDWDFTCSNSILKLWFDAVNDMHQTGQICFNRTCLDRQFDPNDIDFIDVHGFCDASLNAYGGCVYLLYHLKVR